MMITHIIFMNIKGFSWHQKLVLLRKLQLIRTFPLFCPVKAREKGQYMRPNFSKYCWCGTLVGKIQSSSQYLKKMHRKSQKNKIFVKGNNSSNYRSNAKQKVQRATSCTCVTFVDGLERVAIFGFLTGLENIKFSDGPGKPDINLEEDPEIWLLVKFLWILFRIQVENQRSEQPSFSDWLEKHKLGRGRWDLLHVKFRWIPFSNFRGEVENVSANQQPGGHLVFPIGPENTNLVQDVEILIPVKFHWNAFSGFRGEV